MEDYFKNGNPDGKSRREIFGEPMRAIPAFRGPGPRLELMNELGVDRSLMFPTLASLVEEPMRDDPALIHIVVHALNQWLDEVWGFNYLNRIYTVAVVSLPIVEKAIEELDWVVARGARAVLIRPAPVPGYRGPRSFALPEFDPFWQRCVEHDVLVAMHTSDSGYARYDGALYRFPRLKVAVIESGSRWLFPLLDQLADVYKKTPESFPGGDPVEEIKNRIHVSPFYEDGVSDLIDLVGVDRVLFGSDFPHPEGLAQPTHFADALGHLPLEDQAKIMGGNLSRLVTV